MSGGDDIHATRRTEPNGVEPSFPKMIFSARSLVRAVFPVSPTPPG